MTTTGNEQGPIERPVEQGPPEGSPVQQPPTPRFSRLAVVAFVAAFILPLVAIVAGHVALGQIARSGDRGRGLALAATVLGYLFSAVMVGLIAVYGAALMSLAGL